MKKYYLALLATLALAACTGHNNHPTTSSTESKNNVTTTPVNAGPTTNNVLTSTIPKHKNESLLFAITGSRATLTPGINGWYKLSLTGINNNTLWFTDRPIRKSGIINIKKFVDLWTSDHKDGFKRDNPNATLVSFLEQDRTPSQHSIALQIADATYDIKTDTVSYNVKPLSASSETIALLNSNPNLYDVALFIDNWCAFCS